MSSKPILVVAAHPDDEVLGCGGTIARLVDEGHRVTVRILGEGITSRYKHREDADISEIKALHEKTHEAVEILGVEDVEIYDFPDNRFDSVDFLDLVKSIEQIIADTDPVRIFTHAGGDLNVDHRLVQRAVLTASRPTSSDGVEEILSFEVPSSTEWSFRQFSPPFSPNSFVGIEGWFERKIEALNVYDSEVREFPHPRSTASVRALARQRGSQIGCPLAEAFELIWRRGI